MTQAGEPEGAAPPAGDPELHELEALADEIEQEAADQPEGDWQHGGGGAAPAAAGQPAGDAHFVQDCWEQATDLNSGHPYWFNRATGVSQWHVPPGWGAAAAPPASAGEAGGAQPAAAAQQQEQQRAPPSDSKAYTHGYYYHDAKEQLQGPFTLGQLREWRGLLPMNLPILQLTEGKPSTAAAGAADAPVAGDGQQQQAAAAAAASGPPAAAVAVSRKGRWVQLELAGLLGDDELLHRWRLENPEQAAWPSSAPPAPAYEAERQQGSAHALAQAVLSGLPVHDEAVAVARMAAAAGKSIQEVADWGRNADYTATAYRVAARGRIQAGDGRESLYAEAASWVDPASLERQLAAAAEHRKRVLKGQELRAVIERKKEQKRQKQTAWLYT